MEGQYHQLVKTLREHGPFARRELDRLNLIAALKAASGNVCKAAVLIGVSQRTAYYWIDQFNIDVCKVCNSSEADPPDDDTSHVSGA